MGAKYLDQPLIFGTILVKTSELVSARAESTTRVVRSPSIARRLSRDVSLTVFQCADNSVLSRDDFANPSGMRTRSLNDARGRSIDNGRDAAGLGVEEIALIHAELFGWPVGKCVP